MDVALAISPWLPRATLLEAAEVWKVRDKLRKCFKLCVEGRAEHCVWRAESSLQVMSAKWILGVSQ